LNEDPSLHIMPFEHLLFRVLVFVNAPEIISSFWMKEVPFI